VRSEVQILPGPPVSDEQTAESQKRQFCILVFWHGGVAQLGERLLCKQEVDGSIPFTSTTFVGRPAETRQLRGRTDGFAEPRAILEWGARVRHLLMDNCEEASCDRDGNVGSRGLAL
jgi:hypothetical protein